MRIAVDEIPASGRVVAFAQHDSWAVGAAAASLDRDVESLVGELTLQRASQKGVVRVDVRCNVAVEAVCDRCANACRLELEVECALLYAPEESDGDAFDGGEIELESDDLDVGWYSDRRIEAGDVLREAIALALPGRVVCADVAECDKRTAELLSSTQEGAAKASPFASIGEWARGRNRSEDVH